MTTHGRHVGILSIQGSQFQIAEIPLKTVRPFIHDEVALSQCAQEPLNEIDMEDRDSITRYLRKKVSWGEDVSAWRLTRQVGELIKEAKRDWKERHEDDEQETEMMLPLIRLKVGYRAVKCRRLRQVETTGAKEMSNPVRFGQDFIGKVANPRDILQYYRKKQATERSESGGSGRQFWLTGRTEEQCRRAGGFGRCLDGRGRRRVDDRRPTIKAQDVELSQAVPEGAGAGCTGRGRNGERGDAVRGERRQGRNKRVGFAGMR